MCFRPIYYALKQLFESEQTSVVTMEVVDDPITFMIYLLIT